MGSGDGDANGPTTCSSVSVSYDLYDAGEQPVIADFDFPSMFEELAPPQVMGDPTSQGGSVLVRQSRSFCDSNQMDFSYNQVTGGPLPESDDSGTSVEFAGKSRDVYRLLNNNDQARLGVNLPTDVRGEARDFLLMVNVDYEPATGEVSGECETAINEAGRHVVESLSPNSDVTLG